MIRRRGAGDGQPDVPNNALASDDGSPIVTDAGEYIIVST